MMKSIKFKLLQRRAISALVILLLLAPSVLSAILRPVTVSALSQMTERHITISTSVLGASNVTYSVSFKVKTAGTIKGIIVDICQDSPLLGTVCGRTNGVANTPTSSTVGVSKNGGSSTNFNVGANSLSTGLLSLTNASGIATVNGDLITFSFTATNPTGTFTTSSAVGTFYGRLVTFSTTADTLLYDSSGTTVNPGSNTIDQGGLALSTAKQLTTNARVQEQLSFCVGGTTTDDATNAVATATPACSALFTGGATCGTGTTIDLGVIDNTAINVSPVQPADGGNACNGAAMVQTNASFGVNIAYFAEPDSASSNHKGALKVQGSDCTTALPSNTDQCFNSSTTQGVFTKGTEAFGVTVAGVNCNSVGAYACTFAAGTAGTDYSLIRDAAYDGDGTSTYQAEAGRITAAPTVNGFAWNDDQAGVVLNSLADSGAAGGNIKVVDNEALILKFAATAGITTPTGQYSVVSTYVATPSY